VTLIVLNTLITTGLFLLMVFLVMKSHIFLETLVRQTRLPAQALFIQLMTEQLRTLIFYMLIAFVIAVLSTAVLTMLISHRMAGPINRLNGFFTQITKTGDFPPDVRFRSGDFFQELPPKINEAFLAIRKRWLR
jgi:nitrogen fixation/metabolism regulation signal transduction histidine kinase